MSSVPEDINDAIEQNAKGPKKVQVGRTAVEQHGLGDQIEADQYTAGQKAADKIGFGLRSQRIVPPGAG